MLRCAILDDYQDVARRLADWSVLALDVSVEALHHHLETDDALVAALQDFEIVVAMRERTPFTRARLQRLGRLRLLVATGMFHPEIDFAAAAERGVTICGSQGHVHGTPEMTWGLMLALLRHIPEEAAKMREGRQWQSTLGGDLAGRHLGIVGLGRIGQRVARVGLAFGMQVSAWSHNLTQERCALQGVALAASLDALLASADVVTLHIVLSTRTAGLIGARELALMKPDAILVNTSRGGLIVEEALIAALSKGRIAGAALDVFDREPLPLDHPYRRTPRLLATPHLGFATHANFAAHYGQAVENIRAWLDGAPIRTLTDAGAHASVPTSSP